MPTSTDPDHLVSRLETQAAELTQQLQETLRLLHTAATARHMAAHDGPFAECADPACWQLRDRLQRFRLPGLPTILPGEHIDLPTLIFVDHE